MAQVLQFPKRDEVAESFKRMDALIARERERILLNQLILTKESSRD